MTKKENIIPPAVPVGKKIKQLRLALGLSQSDAAFLAHIDVSNFGKIERGKANPNLATLARLAFALESTVSELTAEVTADNLSARERALSTRVFIEARKTGRWGTL